MKRAICAAMLLVPAAMAMSGCATVKGAAIGGAAGAGVAAVSGGNVGKGAAIGGVAGGVIGTVAN
ncbi:MAG TPA: hypothetical protein VF503_25555 [Sphingobium sp.]|uniref:hypothetical protein n=1 Tax=Sphingobium sp. TaxID=1912891 RepID=UPI002ED2FB70